MPITNNPHGFAPTFDVDPYHDPRLDSSLNSGTFKIDSRGVGKISAHDITGINNGNFTLQPFDTYQGQMITATLELDEFQMSRMDDVDMKNKVLNSLVNELLSAKCIEFTKQYDVATNTTKVRARIFATPDSQIRVIRQTVK